MDKYIYNNNNRLWYELQGRLLHSLSDFASQRRKPIGIYGQQHLRYLKEYRKNTYLNLLTSGKLNSYLADIDQQVQEQLNTLVVQMKQAQGITEQLKAENALEWARRMNNIWACAMEIVNREIIYA